MNSCELTMSITALANALACRFSDDELSLAAAAFTQLGDTLASISVQRALCPKEAPTAKHIQGTRDMGADLPQKHQ